MNVKELMDFLSTRHPDDYVQVIASVGDEGYELRDLDVHQAMEWDEDGEGLDKVPGVEIVCRVPARASKDVTDEYIELLVQARAEYLRLLDKGKVEQEDEWVLRSAVLPWSRVVRLLAAELGIESRLTGVLVPHDKYPEAEPWPYDLTTDRHHRRAGDDVA